MSFFCVCVSCMFTCVQSVCSPNRPVLYWAGRQTESEWPGLDCTSSPEGRNAAVDRERRTDRDTVMSYWETQFYRNTQNTHTKSVKPTSPSVQSSMMIHTGFSVITPISLTMWGWSNWRIVTAGKTHMHTWYETSHISETCQVCHVECVCVVLRASCRNFSLTLSEVQFLQVLMATGRPGLSCTTHSTQISSGRTEYMQYM